MTRSISYFNQMRQTISKIQYSTGISINFNLFLPIWFQNYGNFTMKSSTIDVDYRFLKLLSRQISKSLNDWTEKNFLLEFTTATVL